MAAQTKTSTKMDTSFECDQIIKNNYVAFNSSMFFFSQKQPLIQTKILCCIQCPST